MAQKIYTGANVKTVKGEGDHGVVNTVRMQATYAGVILSGRFYTDTSEGDMDDLDNGRVVKLSEIEDDNKEVYKCVAPSATEDKVYLVATPELIYDESTMAKGLDDFYNAEGEAMRLFNLYVGDEFELSVDNINCISTDDPQVDNYLAVEAGETKLKEYESANIPGDAKLVAKIEDVEDWGAREIKMVLVRVTKSE